MFNRSFKSILIILLLLHSSQFVWSQHTFSINVGQSSGLPSSTVYDFIQDSKGFIWIASNAGLTRYDGFEFLTYTSDKQTSLPGSSIKEDKYGRIWYQNFDGYLYYVKNDQLFPIQQNRPGEYVPFGLVGDYLFTVQKEGVDVFDLKSLKIIHKIKVEALNIISSTVLKDAFYFVAENHVFKIGKDFGLQKMDYFQKNNLRINHINNDGDNLFLVYKNTDIHTVYFVDEKLSYLSQKKYETSGSILTDQFLNNQYWFYTNKGFYVYDKQDKIVLSNADLKLDQTINKCLIDKSGNYWFSSLKNGLYLITDFNNKIYPFEQFELMNIIQKDSKFLLSTQKSQIIETNADFNYQKTIVDLGGNNHILNFLYDKENDLLFYTTSLGLNVYHNQKDVYFEDVAVKNIMKLDRKYYAVTTSGYVMLMKNPVFKDVSYESKWDDLYEKNQSPIYKNLAPLLSNLRAKSLDFFEDSSSFIVTSNVGVYLFDTKGHSEFLIEGKHFFASDVYTYNKKVYLLDNNGNFHVVYRSGKLSCLNQEIGIPNNGIKFIKRFGNILYLVCSNRVFEYDLTYSTSVTYSFNTNMLSITDLYLAKDKLILVAGEKIVTIGLNKKSIQKESPQFYYNNFYVGNERVILQDLLSLSSDQNSIKITYSLLDFGSNKEPRMSYRINQGEWIQLVAGAREIQLLSLSPGDYLLEMKMNNNVLNNKIKFHINYPIYLRWWFILLMIVFLVTLTALGYYWRIQRMQNKIQQLNEKIILENELRTSMLTSIKAQMNPHFFYNALNTIQAYIFSNDKFHATTYLAKFSKLTRMILEMSGQKTVKLEDEITSLKLYLELEQMRFQSDFNFEIIVDESIDVQTEEIPSMLIQPYVENAVKHGLLHKTGEKFVSVTFIDKSDLLEIIIEDNGVGRKRSNEINQQKFDKPKSFSTESTKKRLDLINHNIDIVSVVFEDKINNNSEAIGTKVTLFISK